MTLFNPAVRDHSSMVDRGIRRVSRQAHILQVVTDLVSRKSSGHGRRMSRRSRCKAGETGFLAYRDVSSAQVQICELNESKLILQ